MNTASRPRTLILFVGDIGFFILALWVSLFVRSFELPSQEIFLAHLAPFSLLFIAWVIVYLIAGLYESRSIILARRAISAALLYAQAFNIGIAALFFFFVPLFGIAPKTLLFIYAVVSFLFVLLWRVVLFPRLAQKSEAAIVVGDGKEITELVDALRAAPLAPAHIVSIVPPDAAVIEAVRAAIERYRPGFIIADFNNPRIAGAFPELFNYLSRGIRFIDALTLYEEVFGRVPLSVIDERWLARNVSRYAHVLYDSAKRLMDILVALPAAVISLICYPFIAIAVLFESGFPVMLRNL